jgi:hypothetical protein
MLREKATGLRSSRAPFPQTDPSHGPAAGRSSSGPRTQSQLAGDRAASLRDMVQSTSRCAVHDDLPARLIPVRQIADLRDHRQTMPGVNVGQVDARREPVAIPPPSASHQVQASRTGLGTRAAVLPVCLVDLADRFGYQHLDGLTAQVVAVIPKQQLRLSADKPDQARRVHPHPGMGCDMRRRHLPRLSHQVAPLPAPVGPVRRKRRVRRFGWDEIARPLMAMREDAHPSGRQMYLCTCTLLGRILVH